MSAEVTTLDDFVDILNATTTENYEFPTTMADVFPTESVGNSTTADAHYAVFEAFNIMEIVMTSLEMMVWIIAAIKMPRWRRNYRNQMLMQISLARFFKRVIFTFKFMQIHHRISSWTHVNEALNSSQIYIDFVIVILVFFFIKHMYDSLIIVVVKIRQNSLYKVSLCSWLLPVPICGVWTAVILCHALKEKLVYLIICCLFRWPLIFMGTSVYIMTLYKVLSDKIRKFARSLTVVTFLMCLMINFYLFSKDVIELWCFDSFETKIISHVSGLIMNFLILSFYIILITLDYNHCNQIPKPFVAVANYSFADSCKVSNINE